MIRCYMYDGNVEPVKALVETSKLASIQTDKCPSRITVIIYTKEQDALWEQVDAVIAKLHNDVALTLSYVAYI